MRCLIIDDEEMSRTHLNRICTKIPDVEIVATLEDALSAYQYLQGNQVDLLFLDVEMPDFSGIELMQQLQNPPAVIFITSKKEYAVQAFEFIENVVDYVLKPASLPRLLKAVERYRTLNGTHPTAPPSTSSPSAVIKSPQDKKPDEDGKYLFVKTDRKYVRIDLDDLLYVETVGDYSIFKTKTAQFTVHATLKSIHERLKFPNFLKVHRSFIVNLDKVKDIEDNNLLIHNKIIPISRTHRTELMDRIMPL